MSAWGEAPGQGPDNKINKKHVSKNLFSSNSNEINTGIVHEKYKDYNKNPV